jgi:hypothetical protein
MFRRLITPRLRWRQRIPSWLALLAQAATLVGLPLPVEAANKDRSVPFPCQHRSCGCMSASDCWRSCCCFSARDRLSWVRERGQEEPEVLVEAAAHEAEAETDSCCSHSTRCCSKSSSPAKPKPPSPSKPNPEKPLVRWTFGISATSCKSKFGTLMADETRAIADAWIVVSPDHTLDACIPSIHLHSRVVRLPLDVPPPRSAV